MRRARFCVILADVEPLTTTGAFMLGAGTCVVHGYHGRRVCPLCATAPAPDALVSQPPFLLPLVTAAGVYPAAVPLAHHEGARLAAPPSLRVA